MKNRSLRTVNQGEAWLGLTIHCEGDVLDVIGREELPGAGRGGVWLVGSQVKRGMKNRRPRGRESGGAGPRQ